MENIITIDGSNGGGQILRTALALSTITKKSFYIKNIRGKRKDPGLKPQHLTGIEVIKKITGAKCDAKLKDIELTFEPGKCSQTKEDIDIGTAGSITLLLQCLLPILIHSKKISNLKIIGGTDVNWSPSIYYYKEVIIPALKQYADIKLNILKHGFYPKGQGIIEIMIKPTKIQEPIIKINRGNMIQINGEIISSMELQEKKVSERIKNVEDLYLQKISNSKRISTAYANTSSIGVTTTLVSKYENINIGSDKLGEQGVQSEEIAKNCAIELLKRIESKGCCDENLADNLIPYIGLYGGEITTSNITEHIKTNVEITNLFLDDKKIIIEEKENKIIIKKIN